MVSILSFFTKKRPKTTASETSDPRRPSSPTPAPATISSPRTSTSTRIARTKSAARTPVTAAFKDRRASVDGYGLSKRKGAAPTATPAVAAAPPRITIDLPFEFESEADAGVTGKRAARQTLPASHSLSLGLDAVGGTPIITPAERRVLDSQRYTPADLRKAWEWLGTEVKERGAYWT